MKHCLPPLPLPVAIQTLLYPDPQYSSRQGAQSPPRDSTEPLSTEIQKFKLMPSKRWSSNNEVLHSHLANCLKCQQGTRDANARSARLICTLSFRLQPQEGWQCSGQIQPRHLSHLCTPRDMSPDSPSLDTHTGHISAFANRLAS